jgi:PTS system nitrogen regulatory IIA component
VLAGLVLSALGDTVTVHAMIAELLTAALVFPSLRATERSAVIRELGANLARQHPGVTARKAVRALLAREALGSTALGSGLAIPHAKLESLAGPIACLGRSLSGIDFGAPDGTLTHLFFVLLAPPESSGEHLKVLARISRLFHEPSLGRRLRAAGSAAEICSILAAEEARR